MKQYLQLPRVLALYPSSRGFAFVFFRQFSFPLDWGVKEIRGKEKNNAMLDAIHTLFERCPPDVVLLEDTTAKGSRRSLRIRQLYALIARLAEAQGITVVRYTPEQIQQSFAPREVPTKYDIAQVIAERIPMFAPRLPRVRKIWMSEDPRQSLFDAAALGFTYDHVRHGHAPEEKRRLHVRDVIAWPQTVLRTMDTQRSAYGIA